LDGLRGLLRVLNASVVAYTGFLFFGGRGVDVSLRLHNAVTQPHNEPVCGRPIAVLRERPWGFHSSDEDLSLGA
jgi:hypothetical protein